jgi:hypothetical protein
MAALLSGREQGVALPGNDLWLIAALPIGKAVQSGHRAAPLSGAVVRAAHLAEHRVILGVTPPDTRQLYKGSLPGRNHTLPAAALGVLLLCRHEQSRPLSRVAAAIGRNAEMPKICGCLCLP